MALVEIKPIYGNRWHKNDEKQAFDKPFKVRACVDKVTHTYAVSLSEAQKERLSKKLGLDLSCNYDPTNPHKFWELNPSAVVSLEHRANIFDTENPYDEIKLGILKGSKFVANTLSEFRDGFYPEARFVIHDIEDDIKTKERKYAEKKALIRKLDSMPRHQKEEVLRILLGESYSEQSNDFIDMKILECEAKFSVKEIYDILERDSQYNFVNALLIEAISKNVLRKEGNSIYYFSERIGYNTTEAIDFLLDDNNSSVLNSILAQARPSKEANVKSVFSEEEKKKNIAIKKK